MTMKRMLTAMILATGLASLILTESSSAAEMTWIVQSEYPYKVQIEFYSQNYSRSWPGNGRAWGLDDDAEHRFTLSCRVGEKICYGAWETGGGNGRAWGVGPDDENSCNHCCHVCGNGDPRMVVLE